MLYMVYSDFCEMCISIKKMIEKKNMEDCFNFVNLENLKFEISSKEKKNLSFSVPSFFTKNDNDEINIIPTDTILSWINDYK